MDMIISNGVLTRMSQSSLCVSGRERDWTGTGTRRDWTDAGPQPDLLGVEAEDRSLAAARGVG